jgi:hypothetical protein
MFCSSRNFKQTESYSVTSTCRTTTEIPPIQQHEFEYAFLPYCGPSCILSPLHDCVQPRAGRLALKRIPKRKRALLLKLDTREEAWGIQAHHKPHALIVFLYHVLMSAGTFAFWIYWQRTHPGDLQNATVPLTVVAVLISLFWSSTGVLKAFDGENEVSHKMSG